MTKNPYPEMLIDEVSGIEVPDTRNKIWEEGYRAGKEDGKVIRDVIRSRNDLVIVFDGRGKQMPAYQGRYEDVRSKILAHAPESARFFHEHETIARKDW